MSVVKKIVLIGQTALFGFGHEFSSVEGGDFRVSVYIYIKTTNVSPSGEIHCGLQWSDDAGEANRLLDLSNVDYGNSSSSFAQDTTVIHLCPGRRLSDWRQYVSGCNSYSFSPWSPRCSSTRSRVSVLRHIYLPSLRHFYGFLT